MLEVVDDRIGQRLVEDRREVGAPHDPGEEDPRHDREGEHPDDPAVEHRQDEPPPELRSGHPEQERDRRPERQQRRRHEREQDVLEHVDREQGRVVALDDRLEGHRDRDQAGQERDHPDTRHRVRRVHRVDASDGPQVGRGDKQQRQRHERIERPVEEHVRGDRREQRIGAMGGCDGRDERPDEADDPDRGHRPQVRAERCAPQPAGGCGAGTGSTGRLMVAASCHGTSGHRVPGSLPSKRRAEYHVRGFAPRAWPCLRTPAGVSPGPGADRRSTARGPRMPTTRNKATRLAALALPLLALLVAGCASQVPGLYPPQAVTEQGATVSNLYDIVFVIAAIVFFIVEGAIVYAVVRYRRKPTDTELPPQIHGNNLVEIIWTVIPTVIVLFLFVISWQALNTVDAVTANPAVRVVAVAQRFSWNFVYVDADGKPLFTTDAKGDGVFGTLEVPPGVPIHVALHSPDVIHAFYVPKFLFKRDVVPGRTNDFDFTVDPGDAGQTFRGQCAELCGIGHGGMTFDVHASNSLADFQTWLAQQVANKYSGPPAGPSGAPASGARRVALRRVARRPRAVPLRVAPPPDHPSRSRPSISPMTSQPSTHPPASRSRSRSRTTTPASSTTSRSRRRTAATRSRARSSPVL